MTHHVSAMLETHPKDLGGVDRRKLAECIEACLACAQTCTACADACLSEDMVAEMRRCIRLNLDCADVCAATGRVLTRRAETDPALVRSLVEACRAACADECEKHAGMHEHCRVCAEACRRCEAACAALLTDLV